MVDFCIHDLPAVAHSSYAGFFHDRLMRLGIDPERSGLLQARCATRLKVSAWIGPDASYRDFLVTDQGRLWGLLQTQTPDQLHWLPFSLGLMLSERFINLHTDWFALTAGSDERVPAALIRQIDFWRQVNPRVSLLGRSPTMSVSGISHFGLILLMAMASAEHPLASALLAFKFRFDLATTALQHKESLKIAPHEHSMIERAVVGFLRFDALK